jgi:hypothetical protein
MDELWALVVKDWDKHRDWFHANVVDMEEWMLLFADIIDKMSEQIQSKKKQEKKRQKKRKKHKMRLE